MLHLILLKLSHHLLVNCISVTTDDNQCVGLSGSPPGSYSQNIPHKYGMPTPATPPTLPPQLLQVILNTETPLQQVCEVLPILIPTTAVKILKRLHGVLLLSYFHKNYGDPVIE
jgi:hypothetical protein